MATKKENAYEKLENIVMERVFFFLLENENAQLKQELTTARAKLSVYERIATITNSKNTLGFGPPITQEGGND